MKPMGAVFALLTFAAATALPALARDFVQDSAGMLSADTVQQLNTRIGNFNAQTRKEVVVITVPSVEGGTLADVRNAAERAFAQNQVDGVLIYVDKGDRKDYIIPDRAGVQAGWFTSGTTSAIRQAMETKFRDGDFDGGITTAVSGVLDVYRSHVGSRNAAPATSRQPYATTASSGGVHFNVFWIVILAIIAFLVLRSIMRSMSGPRYYGGGPGAPGQGPGPGGPGYGAGYGPGYGYGGGGGGFWSGLLGGLGGAWLGNEMFNNRGGGNIGGGDVTGAATGGAWGGSDAGDSGGGWQSDAGQADLGGSSGGDFGGGGFGDSGGGFGGGGGGGDSGGGW